MRQLPAKPEGKTAAKLPNAVAASAPAPASPPTVRPCAVPARTAGLDEALPALRIGVALVAEMGAGLVLPTLRRLWLNRRTRW